MNPAQMPSGVWMHHLVQQIQILFYSETIWCFKAQQQDPESSLWLTGSWRSDVKSRSAGWSFLFALSTETLRFSQPLGVNRQTQTALKRLLQFRSTFQAFSGFAGEIFGASTKSMGWMLNGLGQELLLRASPDVWDIYLFFLHFAFCKYWKFIVKICNPDSDGTDFLPTEWKLHEGKSFHSCIRACKRNHTSDSLNVIHSFIQHPPNSHPFTAHGTRSASTNTKSACYPADVVCGNSVTDKRHAAPLSVVKGCTRGVKKETFLSRRSLVTLVGVSLHNNSTDASCFLVLAAGLIDP